jgi:Leucine rich repeat
MARTCIMNALISISYFRTIILTDDNLVKGLMFNNNKKVEQLPQHVGENFPNLLGYNATGCSVKEIFEETFKGLKKLKFLYLNENQIETIGLATFEGLVDLEVLWLSKKHFNGLFTKYSQFFADNNKIQIANGVVFQGPTKLREVLLEGNFCIDENFKFTEPMQIAKFRQKISDNCELEKNRPSTEKNKNPATTEMTLRTSMKTYEETTSTPSFTNPNLLITSTVKTVATVISAIIVVLVCITAGLCCFMKYCGRKNQTSPLPNVIKVRLLRDGTMQVIGSPMSGSPSFVSRSSIRSVTTMSTRSVSTIGSPTTQLSISRSLISQASSNLTLTTQTTLNQTPISQKRTHQTIKKESPTSRLTTTKEPTTKEPTTKEPTTKEPTIPTPSTEELTSPTQATEELTITTPITEESTIPTPSTEELTSPTQATEELTSPTPITEELKIPTPSNEELTLLTPSNQKLTISNQTPIFGSPISERPIGQTQMSLVNFVFDKRETLTTDTSKGQTPNDSNNDE